MRNLFRQFLDLIPDPALQVGTVIAINAGVATLALPGGGTLHVRGVAAIGQKVFARHGVIEGPAPDLPIELIEI